MPRAVGQRNVQFRREAEALECDHVARRLDADRQTAKAAEIELFLRGFELLRFAILCSV